jgi:hypothetical protein
MDWVYPYWFVVGFWLSAFCLLLYFMDKYNKRHHELMGDLDTSRWD